MNDMEQTTDTQTAELATVALGAALDAAARRFPDASSYAAAVTADPWWLQDVPRLAEDVRFLFGSDLQGAEHHEDRRALLTEVLSGADVAAALFGEDSDDAVPIVVRRLAEAHGA